ncbi:hypothetical protein, partial [Klebsiella pneumoniae]|uniref:hypothetical protein n=1 Tax=Klebsiella pneumoniae TaxID=573 RepID=UPI000B3FF4DD
KRAYCLKTQPATGETYPKSDLFNKAGYSATALLPDLLPLIGLAVIVIGVGLKSYRKTLD